MWSRAGRRDKPVERWAVLTMTPSRVKVQLKSNGKRRLLYEKIAVCLRGRSSWMCRCVTPGGGDKQCGRAGLQVAPCSTVSLRYAALTVFGRILNLNVSVVIPYPHCAIRAARCGVGVLICTARCFNIADKWELESTSSDTSDWCVLY